MLKEAVLIPSIISDCNANTASNQTLAQTSKGWCIHFMTIFAE